MVCIQCYLPPILFMVYMKLIHPYLAPFIEPVIDKVVAMIWGPQAVTQGCPIKPKNKTGESKQAEKGGDSVQPSTSTAGPAKNKDD